MSFSLSTEPFAPADLDATLAPLVDQAMGSRPADDEAATRELIANGWAAARQLVAAVGSGTPNHRVRVSLSGHATVGHTAAAGSEETLTVSVTAVAGDTTVEGTQAGGDPDAQGQSTNEQAQATAEGTTSPPGTSGPATV